MNGLKEKILQGALKSLESAGIDNLKKVIHNSEEEKREQGLLFCGSTDVPPFGDLSRSYLCAGTHCKVDIKDCKGNNRLKPITAKGKKQIGTFHTHPYSKTSRDIGNLSGEDIYESVSHKHSFSCIGLIEKDKPVIKCFIPAFDIDPIIALKVYKSQDDYDRKLSKVSAEKPNITKESIDELTKAYDERIKTDDELYQASKSLANKLLSKEADLIIK